MREKKRRTTFSHRGYILRSYTELMWARLMDSIGLFYLYEPHLIRLQGCSYLPDFYLPDADMYLEVKGTFATDEEKWKAEQVLEVTGRPVYILEGMPRSDRGGFMNARMSFPGRHGWVGISLFELGEMYGAELGLDKYAAALLSVRDSDGDWVRSAGSILDEVISEMISRNENEARLRALHSDANQKRLYGRGEPTKLDQCIAFWRRHAHGDQRGTLA